MSNDEPSSSQQPVSPERQAENPHTNDRVDPRNKLNDLSGREWTYALRSVIATRYPTSGEASYAHALRRAHPSPKPPQLMAELVRFFTKRGGRVLDPFAGVGGTLLACTMEGRHGVGVELSSEYAEIYAAVCQKLDLAPQPLITGDARRMAEYEQIREAPFDLVLTDPPYAQMMARPKTGERKKRGQGDATPFTVDPADLGNLDYWSFLAALRETLGLATTFLKPRGYLVLFTKDFQPTREHHNLLHADLVNELLKLPELSFRGYRIWHDMSQNLYPFGYPFTFVANQVHQFILVFRKEAE